MTSRIIHSALVADLRKASTTLRRLANLSFFCDRGLGLHLLADPRWLRRRLDALEQFLDRLGAHLRNFGAGYFIAQLAVTLVGGAVSAEDLRAVARIDDHVRSK
jgi:hypothetical protein